MKLKILHHNTDEVTALKQTTARSPATIREVIFTGESYPPIRNTWTLCSNVRSFTPTTSRQLLPTDRSLHFLARRRTPCPFQVLHEKLDEPQCRLPMT